MATSLVNRARNQEAQLDVLKPRSTEERKKNASSHMGRKPLKQQSTEHRGGNMVSVVISSLQQSNACAVK